MLGGDVSAGGLEKSMLGIASRPLSRRNPVITIVFGETSKRNETTDTGS